MTGIGIAPKKFEFPHYEDRRIRVEYHRGRVGFTYHYHPQYELTLMRGDAGKRVVGDNLSDYFDPDLVLLGPNLPHSWAYEPLPVKAMKSDWVVVVFTLESLGVELLDRPEMDGVRDLLDRATQGLAFGPDVVPALEPSIRRLVTAQGLDRLLGLLSVLNALSRVRRPPPLVSKGYCPSRNEQEHAALARVLSEIDRRSEGKIPLRDIAQRAGMSIPTFTRFFRRNTGTTFVKYVNEWRTRRACILLRETDKTVLDVGLAVGYENLSHFNRQFRRFVGMSPRAYRKRL
jgi:AraC-like DNA-binding protein